MKSLSSYFKRCLVLGLLALGTTTAWSQREEKTFKVTGTPTVSVSDISGTITITGEKISEVRVTSEKKDPKIEIIMEQTGNRVRVEVKHPDRSGVDFSRWFGGSGDSSDVKIQIVMPDAGNLEARSVSGDVAVSGLRGDIQVKTVSGDLALKNLGERITAETVSGDIRIDQARGEVTLKSISGDLNAQGLEGRLTTSSVSGDSKILQSNLFFTSAETTSGDLYMETPLARSGSYTLNSHSGDVTVRIPKSSSFRLTAKTFSGDFRSEFTQPVTENIAGESNRHTGHSISSTFGSGDADLRVRTFSGNLKIQAQ